MPEQYYTNSTQLPVGYTDDLIEALDLQEPLQTKYTGGTSMHMFIGEKLSAENCKTILKFVFNKYKLPYLSLSPTFSICKEHGYFSGEHFKCPKCEEDCLVYSRIVGYITPINQWNKGKRQEYSERKTFKAEIKTTPD